MFALCAVLSTGDAAAFGRARSGRSAPLVSRMLSTESHSAEELQRDANILAGLGVDVCESLGPLLRG